MKKETEETKKILLILPLELYDAVRKASGEKLAKGDWRYKSVTSTINELLKKSLGMK